MHTTANTIQIRRIDEDTDLFRHYDGQVDAQPVHLSLDTEDGELTCGYNPNIGNAVPIAAAYNRTLSVLIPPLTADAANALLEQVEPIAQRVLNGASIEYNGNEHVGVLDDDATEAYDELIETVDAYCEDPGVPTVSSLNVVDWFAGEDPSSDWGLTADTTDEELAQLEITAEAEIKAAAEGVVVVQGLERYLSDLRDTKRQGARDELEQVAQQIDDLTERRNALIRMAKRFGDSDRAIGYLADLSHTQVQNIVKAGAPRYIVTVDEDTATWLVEGLMSAAGGRRVAQRGSGGEVELTDVGYFRGLGSDDDGSLTEDENGLQMWIEGNPYPVVVS